MNFLLIMLALVLLVGIGSVSAASDDGTDIISDGITDDMLLDDGVTENPDSGDSTDPADLEEPAEPVEKINTTVESEKSIAVRDNETANIPVTVKDNESYAITVAEKDFSLTEGGKALHFTYNGENITLTDKLGLGNHTLILSYLGNDTYANSSATILLSIFGNETLNGPDTVVVDKDGNVEVPISLTNGVNETDVAKDNLTLSLAIDDEPSELSDFTVEGNIIKFNIVDKFSKARLTIFCNINNETINVTIKKGAAVNVVAGDDNAISYNITDDFNITVTVTDLNSNVLTVNQSDIVVSEGNNSLNFTYADSNITITSNLTAGVHNITILYKGNDTYGNATANVVLNIYKNMTMEAPSAIDVNTTKNATISINVTNGIDYLNLTDGSVPIENGTGSIIFADGNLTVAVTYLNENNETVVANISNLEIADGVITFTLDDNNFTSGNVTLSYNETYNATVKLNNIVNVIITPINTNGNYQSGNLTFKVTDADGQINLTNKTIEVKYSTYTGSFTLVTPITLTINEEGIASLNLNTVRVSLFDGNFYNSYIPVGIHELSIGGLGQLKGNNKTNVTIEKANVIITANKFTGDYGTTEKFKITVTNAETGELMKGDVETVSTKTGQKTGLTGADRQPCRPCHSLLQLVSKLRRAHAKQLCKACYDNGNRVELASAAATEEVE